MTSEDARFQLWKSKYCGQFLEKTKDPSLRCVCHGGRMRRENRANPDKNAPSLQFRKAGEGIQKQTKYKSHGLLHPSDSQGRNRLFFIYSHSKNIDIGFF